MATRYPEALKEFPESFQIFIKQIVRRADKGRNVLIGVFGATGTGKSLAAFQINRAVYLYMYGREPTSDYLIKKVFFKAKPFVEAMQKLSDTLHETGKTKTKAWLWDETGISAGHKSHATINNRVIGWLVQTFRNLRQIVIFTTPSISFIDASIMKMLHYYLETVGIDRKNKVAILKPLEIQYNVRMDKIYYHNLTSPSRKGMIELDLMGIPKVSDELEALYETEKNKFTKDLNEEIVDTLDKVENKDKKRWMDSVHRFIFQCWHKGIRKQRAISEEYEKLWGGGVDQTNVSRRMAKMDRETPKWRENPKQREYLM